jgi:hypothetical protein
LTSTSWSWPARPTARIRRPSQIGEPGNHRPATILRNRCSDNGARSVKPRRRIIRQFTPRPCVARKPRSPVSPGTRASPRSSTPGKSAPISRSPGSGGATRSPPHGKQRCAPPSTAFKPRHNAAPDLTLLERNQAPGPAGNDVVITATAADQPLVRLGRDPRSSHGPRAIAGLHEIARSWLPSMTAVVKGRRSGRLPRMRRRLSVSTSFVRRGAAR